MSGMYSECLETGWHGPVQTSERSVRRQNSAAKPDLYRSSHFTIISLLVVSPVQLLAPIHLVVCRFPFLWKTYQGQIRRTHGAIDSTQKCSFVAPLTFRPAAGTSPHPRDKASYRATNFLLLCVSRIFTWPAPSQESQGGRCHPPEKRWKMPW